jgi:hypothetical protein
VVEVEPASQIFTTLLLPAELTARLPPCMRGVVVTPLFDCHLLGCAQLSQHSTSASHSLQNVVQNVVLPPRAAPQVPLRLPQGPLVLHCPQGLPAARGPRPRGTPLWHQQGRAQPHCGGLRCG